MSICSADVQCAVCTDDVKGQYEHASTGITCDTHVGHVRADHAHAFTTLPEVSTSLGPSSSYWVRSKYLGYP